MNWSVGGEITTIDPSKATDVVSFSQMINSMEGLYRNSKDGLTYTFNLRKSKWNDGTPVTAQDFVYSWRRTVNPKTEAEYSYLFPGSRTPMPSKTAKSRFSAWGSRPRASISWSSL